MMIKRCKIQLVVGGQYTVTNRDSFQLAQLVERLTVNQSVAGSSPALGAKIYRGEGKW